MAVIESQITHAKMNHWNHKEEDEELEKVLALMAKCYDEI